MRRLVICSIIVSLSLLACGEGEGPTEADISRLERQIHEKDSLISSLEQKIFEYEHGTQASTVVKGSIVIFGGQYADYVFSVSQDMKNARLKGNFSSTSGGDLCVLVLDDLNFRNWRAGGEAKAWYSSGQVVVGNIDLPLAVPDTYHLVFSNAHSWITKKTVDVSIDLQFQL